MARPLDVYDIAVASIVFYSLFLAGAVVLCFKHGLARSSGWRFLIILAVARLVGSALRLASVSAPSDAGLYVGWMTLNGLGLGPLVLMLLALLGRVFDFINRGRRHVVELLMLVAIILLVVGGIQSTFTVEGGEPSIAYSTASQAGTAIMVAVLGLLCLELLLAFRSRGEHHIILAIALCIPFVLVRLVYSCLVVIGGVSSDVWLYLGMLVIMEMVVVLICQVLGFSLRQGPAPYQGRPGVAPTPPGRRVDKSMAKFEMTAVNGKTVHDPCVDIQVQVLQEPGSPTLCVDREQPDIPT